MKRPVGAWIRPLLFALIAAALLLLGFAAGAFVAPSRNSLWIPVIAALGASFLTGVAGFGLSYLQQWQAGEIAMATTPREIRKLGSGAFRFEKIISDPVEFLRSFNREYMQLFDAWAKVWLSGSPRAVEASNKFVDAAVPAFEAAQSAGKARPAVLSRLLGEAWTREQEKQYGDALTSLGRLRIEFAKVARAELGEEEIDLVVGLPKAT